MPERDNQSLTLDKGGIPSTTCGHPVSGHDKRSVRRWPSLQAAFGKGVTNYGIKNLRPFLGNHRSMFACVDVANDRSVIELNVLETKAGDGGL